MVKYWGIRSDRCRHMALVLKFEPEVGRPLLANDVILKDGTSPPPNIARCRECDLLLDIPNMIISDFEPVNLDGSPYIEPVSIDNLIKQYRSTNEFN